jgi:hypothetical protein
MYHALTLNGYSNFINAVKRQRNLGLGLQVLLNLFHIVMTRFPIPENCSAHVPMILKEFCSSKINGLVMKTFSGK